VKAQSVFSPRTLKLVVKLLNSPKVSKNAYNVANSEKYAVHLGISQQAVSKMIRGGRIPSIHGHIDAAAADLALSQEGNSGDGITLAEAQRRKEAALAKLRATWVWNKIRRLHCSLRRGKSKGLHQFNAKKTLLSLPTKLAARVDTTAKAAVKQIAEAEVRACLEELIKAATLPADFDFDAPPENLSQ
jgi:hypothetical protein